MNNLMKKNMTKKQLKEFYKMNRSCVGSGQNLGTRDMNNSKLYNRNKAKEDMKLMMKFDSL